MEILSYITSLFWEKKCYGCGQLWHFFCPNCSQNMYIYRPYCYVCKKPSDNFTTHEKCKLELGLKQIIVLTRYRQNGVKKVLRHAKYYWKYTAYEGVVLQHKTFFQEYVSFKNSVLMPIPMHLLRKWKRGYNQSEKIAQLLSSILDIPVNNKTIYKKKYTKNQSHLSLSQRKNNLQSSFWVRKNTINRNTTVYLIDDVISTGSTILEAAKELQKKWFQDVRAIVLASD